MYQRITKACVLGLVLLCSRSCGHAVSRLHVNWISVLIDSQTSALLVAPSECLLCFDCAFLSIDSFHFIYSEKTSAFSLLLFLSLGSIPDFLCLIFQSTQGTLQLCCWVVRRMLSSSSFLLQLHCTSFPRCSGASRSSRSMVGSSFFCTLRLESRLGPASSLSPCQLHFVQLPCQRPSSFKTVFSPLPSLFAST